MTSSAAPYPPSSRNGHPALTGNAGKSDPQEPQATPKEPKWTWDVALTDGDTTGIMQLDPFTGEIKELGRWVSASKYANPAALMSGKLGTITGGA